MKKILIPWPFCLCLLFTGCAHETPTPRFPGKIVSHVDSYGSGTGTSSRLSATGNMRTGFDYTDASKTDWEADIKWSFLRREDDADVYRIECIFLRGNQSSGSDIAELLFDGESPAKLPVSDQLIISIEPELSTDGA